MMSLPIRGDEGVRKCKFLTYQLESGEESFGFNNSGLIKAMSSAGGIAGSALALHDSTRSFEG